MMPLEDASLPLPQPRRPACVPAGHLVVPEARLQPHPAEDTRLGCQSGVTNVISQLKWFTRISSKGPDRTPGNPIVTGLPGSVAATPGGVSGNPGPEGPTEDRTLHGKNKTTEVNQAVASCTGGSG